MRLVFISVILILAFSAGVLGYAIFSDPIKVTIPSYSFSGSMQSAVEQKLPASVEIDFSKINSAFAFAGTLPAGFEVEYVSGKKAINVYNASLEGGSNLEKSQLYITFFRASTFLTLSTVDISFQKPLVAQEKEAVLYEITKKSAVPDFEGQPSWRNATHRALDIRMSLESPSVFYSFAYNPEFGDDAFDKFIASLKFEEPAP